MRGTTSANLLIYGYLEVGVTRKSGRQRRVHGPVPWSCFGGGWSSRDLVRSWSIWLSFPTASRNLPGSRSLKKASQSLCICASSTASTVYHYVGWASAFPSWAPAQPATHLIKHWRCQFLKMPLSQKSSPRHKDVLFVREAPLQLNKLNQDLPRTLPEGFLARKLPISSGQW